MNNILITSAGRRVELVKAFKLETKKLDIKVVCIDLCPELSAACLVADLFFSAPEVTSKNYIGFLKKICITNSIKLVIPTIDAELLILSQHKEEFMDLGINIIISDFSLVKACRNKKFTADLFNKMKIETPEIYDVTKIKYPCFVKPYDGSSSRGVFKLNDESMLTKNLLKNPKNIFMEFVPKHFDEYTIDIYYDKFGYMKALVPRLRIETRSGEISKGLTTKGVLYDFLKNKISYIEGARGCIALQLFADLKKHIFKAIEINPRFGGGYPLSYSAGANFPKMLIHEYILGEEFDFLEDWKENLLMLRYDAKILVHDFKL